MAGPIFELIPPNLVRIHIHLQGRRKPLKYGCKLIMFIQILQGINYPHQKKELKSGCAAAHPAHPVPPALYSLVDFSLLGHDR